MQYIVGGEKDICGCVSVSTDTHRGRKEVREDRMEEGKVGRKLGMEGRKGK